MKRNKPHTSKIHNSGDICLLSSSLPDSISIYFYLRLDRNKQKKFFADMDTLPRLKLTDYGEILESGIGETPSTESIEKMLKEHNFTTPVIN